MDRNLQLKKWTIALWFVILFVYICIRAFTVEPMLDELATYFNYIQTGNVMNELALVDANNHLLNSFIGWIFYSLFGDHFVLFRLLAILSFPLYFFSLKWLVEKCVKGQFKWIVFVAITSIPWILEYFSFSRGYGSSLAFFFAGICFLIRFKAEKNARFFFYMLLFFALGISSNLSLLIPCLIASSYAILILLVVWKELSSKWLSMVGVLLFLGFMKVILNHIDKLKSAKALWWGSQDGVWEVTGKSISRIVFFTESVWIKYTLLIFIVVGLAFWVKDQIKKSLKEILFSNTFWIPGLFFACLAAIIILAEFMHINYPMDRVAMYFVPLFILILGMLLSANRYLKWTLLVLIWFPISFVFKMNIESSIFSPEDRFSNDFTYNLENHLSDDNVVSIDFVSHLSYAYWMRKRKGKTHIAVEYLNDQEMNRGDLHVSWIKNYDWDNFKMIYQEPTAGTKLYQRINLPNKILICDTIIPSLSSSDKYINLTDFNLEKYRGKSIQARIESNISLNEGTLKLTIVSHIGNEMSTARLYSGMRFDWYFGHQLNYAFDFPNHPIKMEESDKNYLIYVLNEEFREVKLENTRIRFYLISE